MDIFEYLKEMNNFIERKDWGGLDKRFEAVCTELSGIEVNNLIKSVDLEKYKKDLKNGINTSLKIAKKNNCVVIYFEYDLDNNWDSNFFICEDYATKEKAEEVGDDWACDYLESVEGPSIEAFANMYDGRFDRTEVDMGTTLYLIARTVTVFGEASKGINMDNIALCMAFHDQDPIVRIVENR